MKTINVIFHQKVVFNSRNEAGQLLGKYFLHLKDKNSVVLGIPRGGVVIAQEMARVLKADFDIILAHKLGTSLNPEFAIGAITENGNIFLNTDITHRLGEKDNYIRLEKRRRLHELFYRKKLYRRILPKVSLKNKIVIIVDDGVATGATIHAAVWSVRQEHAERIIVAVPVGSIEAVKKLSEDVDEILCLYMPEEFLAVGQFYKHFDQINDNDVLAILQEEYQRKKVAHEFRIT